MGNKKRSRTIAAIGAVNIPAFGLLFLAFWVVGGFTIRQSLVLSLVSTGLFLRAALNDNGVYNSLLAVIKEDRSFQPFYLQIAPNWDKIATHEYGGYTESEWSEITERIRESDPYRLDDHLFYKNLQFTFLKPDLIYNHANGCFLKNIDFEACFKFPQKCLDTFHPHICT